MTLTVRVLGAVLLWLACVTAGLWWTAAPPAASAAARQTGESWTLDEPPAPKIETQLAAITGRRLWGAGLSPLPAANEPALTPPDWRIAGVYAAAGRAQLVLATEGQADRMLQVGDALPGGARILSITADAIGIALNGKRLSLSIHPE